MRFYKKLLWNTIYAIFCASIIGVLIYVGIITFTLASGKIFYTWEFNRPIAILEFIFIVILIIGFSVHTYFYLEKKTR